MSGKLDFCLDEIVLPDGRTPRQALTVDPWVVEQLLKPVFAVDSDGLPANRVVYLELPRGHWKTGGLAAMALAEATLEPDTHIIVASGDTDQAAIVTDQGDGYMRRNPNLDALFTASGNERIAQDGSRITVISSDHATAWGLGGVSRRFRVYCDELCVWKNEELWSALVSATGKVRDAQVVIASNAGFGQGDAWQWRIRESARTEPWAHLFSPDGCIASWVTPAWMEQQASLLPRQTYERVILNRWSAESGDYISAAQWDACIDERIAGRSRYSSKFRYVAGLDLGLTKDRTVLAVGHRDGDLFILDEMQVFQGSRDEPVSIRAIERAVTDAARRYRGVVIYCDPWQMKGSVERLQGRVRISEFTFSQPSVQRLSVSLYQAVTSGALRVPPDDELRREVLGLRVVESAGGWRFDHRSGGYSDRAVALAMAITGAVRQPRRRGSISVPRGRIQLEASADAR